MLDDTITATDLIDAIGAEHVRYVPAELADNFSSVRSVYAQNKPDTGMVPLVIIPGTYIDGTGYNESLNLANRAVIEEDYGDLSDALLEVTYSLGGSEYSYRLDVIAELHNEYASAPAAGEVVVDMIRSLEDYPVLDDDRMVTIEAEIVERAWDDYLVSDTKRELAQDVRDHADYCEDDNVADALRAAAEEVGAYPSVEGESAYFDSYDLKAIVPAWERRLKELKDLDGKAFTPTQD